MNRRKKILLVEDDPNLSFIIKDNLLDSGYDVTHKSDGIEALSIVNAKTHFDIYLLDVMLPNADGFQIAAQIRANHISTPIIFLTARGMEQDKLKGFKLGADDYITKPFSFDELLARMNAILRRTNQTDTEPTDLYEIGSLKFWPNELKLEGAVESFRMTKKEAALLKVLLDQINSPVKREDILKAVWGDDGYFVGRSMDVYMSKLRKYLKNEPNVNIETIHGVGFKLSTL